MKYCAAGLLMLVFGLNSFGADAKRVVVQGGDEDLEHPVIVLPAGAKAAGVKDGSGTFYPVQIDGDRALFQLRKLAKGEKQTFELVDHVPPTSQDEVAVARSGKKLKITAKDKLLIEYQAEPGDFPRDNIKPLFRRGGYLHPIYSLSGKVITDDFPTNHIHHHGIWWSWSNAEFEGRATDFWNMGDGKGRTEFAALGKTWSGPVHGGFTAQHKHVDLTASEPKTAINETWEVKVYNRWPDEEFWMFDLVSKQECATKAPLKFPEYRYGGIGLRGNWDWNGKDAVNFLTSDGVSDRVKAHTMHGRWCDMHGVIGGQAVGIAILGHPENFRAPEPMRVHPTEPFFNFAPQQAGDFEMVPGKPFTWRYRVVIYEGPPDKALLDRLWAAYAKPPAAKVVAE
jgi:hypothetical protein